MGCVVLARVKGNPSLQTKMTILALEPRLVGKPYPAEGAGKELELKLLCQDEELEETNAGEEEVEEEEEDEENYPATHPTLSKHVANIHRTAQWERKC